MSVAPKFQHRILCGDDYAPTTRDLIFVRAQPPAVCEAVRMWSSSWSMPAGQGLQENRVSGNLREVLQSLLPLTAVGQLQLVVPTNSEWCAYFRNGLTGNNGLAAGELLSKYAGCEAVLIAASERLSAKAEAAGYMPSVGGLGIHYWRSGTLERYVVLHYESRWEFYERGEPLPFENTEAYRSRRLPDRLTFEQVEAAAAWFGLRPFDESFYCPPGTSCTLFERPGVNKWIHQFGWKRKPWPESA
jgi:hypothetical protein